MQNWHKHAAVAVLAAVATFGATKIAAPAKPVPAPTPILELPTVIKTTPGKQVRIVATTEAPIVRWLAPEGCDLTASETGHYAVFSAMVPGKYHIAAWTVQDGKPTPPFVCEVTVEAVGPPAPGPAPPGPIPPGPAPNALVAKLQTVFDQDKQPPAARTDQKIMLVGIYQALAVKAQDKSVKSTTELMSQLRTAIAGLMKTDSLVEVRMLVANEARLQFGEAPVQMTDDLRTRLATFWQSIADALKQVK